MLSIPQDMHARLRQYGQDHVLAGWERLSDDERRHLLGQLAAVDLEELRGLYASRERSFALPAAERIKPAPVVAAPRPKPAKPPPEEGAPPPEKKKPAPKPSDDNPY